MGLGGRARALVNESAGIADMRVVAVSDCFRPAIDRFIADVGKDRNWRGYEDFRQMLDQEKLDGVMVVTTTHARAWVAAHVMQARLAVYLEKPMCLTDCRGSLFSFGGTSLSGGYSGGYTATFDADQQLGQ